MTTREAVEKLVERFGASRTFFVTQQAINYGHSKNQALEYRVTVFDKDNQTCYPSECDTNLEAALGRAIENATKLDSYTAPVFTCDKCKTALTQKQIVLGHKCEGEA